MEISEVRKRLRLAVDRSRREAVERRARADAAVAAYERFLEAVATPVFKMVAMALKAEGFPFTAFTPKDGLRLASERSGEDYIELGLDRTGDEPVVTARISRTHGRRVVSRERPVRESTPPSHLTEEDVLDMLLQEIAPFVER
jgi:hypothetical protein